MAMSFLNFFCQTPNKTQKHTHKERESELVRQVFSSVHSIVQLYCDYDYKRRHHQEKLVKLGVWEFFKLFLQLQQEGIISSK
jgi:hypothetical protein